jgi:hypothetical protein
MINILKIMCIIEYADAYIYACDITLHKHKRTAYTAMWPHFKTMLSPFQGKEKGYPHSHTGRSHRTVVKVQFSFLFFFCMGRI